MYDRHGRRVAAGLTALLLFCATLTTATIQTGGETAQAAGSGSTLVAEEFTGASVSDSRWQGLGDACLTGAAAGGTAPAGASNLTT